MEKIQRDYREQGDKHKLEELFKGEVPDNFNWDDYSIIRIPYELIPKGFMDDKQVARALKATIHTGIYNMEYAYVLPKIAMASLNVVS